MKQSVAAVVLVLSFAAFAAFVFPTRYQYLPGSNARPRVLAVRVDRFTGAAAALSDTGWVPCRYRDALTLLGLPEPNFRPGETAATETR